MRGGFLKLIFENLPRKSKYVFTDPHGKKLVNLYHAHRQAITKAGIKYIRIHDLRHTFASLLIQEGFDIATVSKLLGHKSVKITMEIYYHVHPDHARRVINGNPVKLPVTKRHRYPNGIAKRKTIPGG